MLKRSRLPTAHRCLLRPEAAPVALGRIRALHIRSMDLTWSIRSLVRMQPGAIDRPQRQRPPLRSRDLRMLVRPVQDSLRTRVVGEGPPARGGHHASRRQGLRSFGSLEIFITGALGHNGQDILHGLHRAGFHEIGRPGRRVIMGEHTATPCSHRRSSKARGRPAPDGRRVSRWSRAPAGLRSCPQDRSVSVADARPARGCDPCGARLSQKLRRGASDAA